MSSLYIYMIKTTWTCVFCQLEGWNEDAIAFQFPCTQDEYEEEEQEEEEEPDEDQDQAACSLHVFSSVH